MLIRTILNRLAGPAAALAAIGVSATASAENASTLALINSPTIESGDFYVSLQGGPMWTDLPYYRPGNENITTPANTRPVFDASDRFAMAHGGLTVGHTLPDSLSPLPGWALRQRVEAWFAAAGGSGTTRDDRSPATGTGVRFATINGRAAASGLIFGPPLSQTASVQTDLVTFGGGLRFRFDVKASDRLLLRPALGLTIGHSGRDYSYRMGYGIAGSPTDFTRHEIVEELDTFEIGGEIGMDARYRLTNHLHLIGGFRIAPASVSTEYTGRDCGAFGVPASASCFTAPAFARTTATDDASVFAVRIGLSAGIVLHGDWWTLSVIGFGTWDSASPTISHPTFNQAVTGQARPAHLDHESVWSCGAAFRVDIALY